ncbi:transcriptional regulator [Hoeflea sp. BAL378]|uniref:type II toxin-antitoxin system HicB family antitoxin n=1 Tax=Hoeflea sp. BAL378 TaxID=1547437 RepID=UPI00051473CE|nr:type II toxin-antitoxin system HicB family antitoxin [Hoeflea sp. BAL378]KGF70773.1 transcriptional regulator [Hoeflea sp. BAL378]
MQYIYRAILETDPDGGFLVTFPDVPGAITHGASRADALASAREALGLALRGIIAQDGALPQSRATEAGLVEIAVDPTTALKLAVIEAFAASGLSKSELARRLGRQETEARRILDPDHPTKLALIEAALAVLGREIVVSVREAA